MAGETYTIKLEGEGATDVADYDVTWKCKRTDNDSVIASGTGPTGSFTVPSVNGGVGISCSFTIDAHDNPGIQLDLQAGAPSGTTAGSTIPYTYTVTNTGNTTLTGVAVTDTDLGPVTCAATTLAPGASTTCTADHPYTITQADINAGSVSHGASVSATSQNKGGPPTTVNDSDTATFPLTQNPALTLTATGSLADPNGNGRPDPNEPISYSYTVKNTGNVTVTGIAMTDSLGGTVTCAATTLNPGDETTCTTSTHLLTQGDIDSGSFVNTPKVTGNSPAGPVSDERTVTTDLPRTDSLAITGTGTWTDGNGNGRPDEGENVTYTYTVTNNGNTTISDIEVTDAVTPDAVCPKTQLAPGESMTCTGGPLSLTQAQIDSGSVATTVQASGTGPKGPVDDQAVITTDLNRGSSVTLRIGAVLADPNGNGLADPGEKITYTYTVTNTGNTTLTGLSVSDSNGHPVTCPKTTLPPGGSMTCTAPPYALTQGDIDAGAVNNSATVTGQGPTGGVSDSTTATVDLPRKRALSLQKTAALNDTNENGLADPGERIRYFFEVVNTGTVTMTDVVIDDPMLARAQTQVHCPQTTLAPRQSMICVADYRVTKADATGNKLVNHATVRASSVFGVSASASSRASTPTSNHGNTSSQSQDGPNLADTGGPSGSLLLAAMGLLLSGLVLVVGTRRRRITG